MNIDVLKLKISVQNEIDFKSIGLYYIKQKKNHILQFIYDNDNDKLHL